MKVIIDERIHEVVLFKVLEKHLSLRHDIRYSRPNKTWEISPEEIRAKAAHVER